MRPATKSITGVGVSEWMPLNLHADPFNVGFGCVVSGGAATYDVEHTFDDPAGSPAAFKHPTLVAQNASKDGNYAFPVRAMRINLTAGVGTVTLTAIQAGI